MELVEETYQVAESELNDLKGIYSRFRDDCKLIAKVNRLVSKQAKDRKRKRELETKEREEAEQRKRELEQESQKASQAFFQNLGGNGTTSTVVPAQQYVQPSNVAYSYGSYATNAVDAQGAGGYSYQPYAATSTYMPTHTSSTSGVPATSSAPFHPQFQQHQSEANAPTSLSGSAQVAPNHFGQQYQPTYSQYAQRYNSYSNRNGSNNRRQ